MANEAPEVVIVSDDGTEHVFPPGFDPIQAAAIVKQQSLPPPTGDSDAALTGLEVGGVIDLARAGGAVAKPLLGKTAAYVAQSPVAQRAIGAAVGSAAGSAIPGVGTALGFLGGNQYLKPLVKKAAEGMESWAAVRNATVGRNALGQFTKLAAPAVKLGTAAFTGMGAMMGAESDVLSRLNDPSEIQALTDRIEGKPSDRQPDYIDTLNKWFGNVKAAQQVAPNTVLSASEIKQLNQLVENGIPPPIATQTILQLRGAR